MDGYKHIMEIIKTAPPVSPPSDFTDRVMARIRTLDPSLEGEGVERRSQWSPKGVARSLFVTPATASECSFCFMMAAFFYLILGIVLAAGLRGMGGHLHQGWITYQPAASFAVAFGLGALGLLVRKQSLRALNIVRLCVLIYCGLVLVIGMLLQFQTQATAPANYPLWLAFLAGSILMGAFLALVVHKYRGMHINTVTH